MPKIGDILTFREDLFFDGAVQSDWFYDESRRSRVAAHFVFHGPRYFGLTQSDVGTSSHLLMDTCSFTADLATRLQDGSGMNPFLMAIAGYGTGKSHLVVTLASLFGGSDSSLQSAILKNLEEAGTDIGQYVRTQIGKPNLVLILNGMRDFNLNYELLNAARKSLAMHGLDDSVFKGITKPYDIAKHFVRNNFERLEDFFRKACSLLLPDITSDRLKEAIIGSLEAREEVLTAVNTVYERVNGHPIRWDDGISAYDVLQVLTSQLCGARKPFNKVLILFDEFGRFMEYAGAHPTRAGDAAIQQMFEAIQNSDGDAIFVGFVQSDLRAYMSRIDKSSNVSRYVGRYETSDKVYLSSNLETIFAGLIQRIDQEAFERYVVNRYHQEDQHLEALHRDLLKWCKAASSRGVWQDFGMFRRIVAEGTYPLHPLTVWLLSNLHEWLQQRSALTFVRSAFADIASCELHEFGSMPLIRPVELLDRGLLRELLLAEEQGRQRSRFCTQYESILRRYSDRFTEDEAKVLSANLILRIGQFRTHDRADAVRALQYCTGMAGPSIEKALESLENDHGVMAFDDRVGSFDFIEDAVGANDFRWFIAAKRRETRIDLSIAFQQYEVKQLLGVALPVETDFSIKHHIRTREWQYSQEVIGIDALDKEQVRYLKSRWTNALSPDAPKGQLIWVYVNSESHPLSIERLQELIKEEQLSDLPIIFALLDDKDDRLADSLRDFMILGNISDVEKARYNRFFADFEAKTRATLAETAAMLMSERKIVTPEGVIRSPHRISRLASDLFEKIYPDAVPFPFEGFHNRSGPAKKILSQLARQLCGGLIGEQWVQLATSDVRNRFTAVLFAGGGPGSWGVVSQDYRVTAPQEPNVRHLMTSLDTAIPTSGSLELKQLLSGMLMPPYGMNDFAAALLVACFLTLNRNNLRILLNGSPIRLSDWANHAFADKTVDFEVLEQTSIERRMETNRIPAFCARVEANTDMEECVRLNEELDRILAEEDITSEYAGQIEACRIIIDEGLELNRKYESCLRHAASEVSAAKGNDAHRPLNAIKALKRLNSSLVSPRYSLSKYQLTRIDNLLRKADMALRANGAEWVSSLSCTGLTQVGQFQTWTKRVIQDLREHGYHELAEQAQDRVNWILDNLNEIRKLSVVREEVERFDRVCRPSDFTSYAQLKDWEGQAEKLKDYIEKSAIPGYEKTRLLDTVTARLLQIRSALENINQQIADVIERSLSVRTLEDCENLYSTIRNLLERTLREQDDRDLRRLANDLHDFTEHISQVRRCELDPSRLTAEIGRLTEIWEARTEDIAATCVLEGVLEDAMKRCAEFEQQWVSRYLEIPKPIDHWSAEECSNWLAAVSPPPPYVSQHYLTLLRKTADRVSARQAAIPVEAIVEAFNRLTEEQKMLCLRILSAQVVDSNA